SQNAHTKANRIRSDRRLGVPRIVQASDRQEKSIVVETQYFASLQLDHLTPSFHPSMFFHPRFARFRPHRFGRAIWRQAVAMSARFKIGRASCRERVSI